MFTSHDEEDNIPVNMPDLIRKRFGYNQRAARIGPGPTSRIRFSTVFPKKAGITLRKTDLDPILMAWSGFGQRHLVWKQAGVQ